MGILKVLRFRTNLYRHLLAKDGCKDESKMFCAEDSKCYDASLQCNYNIDCADESDEHDCSKYIFFAQTLFARVSQSVCQSVSQSVCHSVSLSII